MSHTAIATIDLSAIRHNLQQVRTLAPAANIMAVVKADAYGHGLIEVANTLSEADGLAVARLEEALHLRSAGITAPILLLSGIQDQLDLQRCAENAIDVVIHSLNQAELLNDCSLAKPLTVWLKLDSGMHRLGLTPQQLHQAYAQLQHNPNVKAMVLMTHFSSSEQSNRQHTEQQLSQFDQAIGALDLPKSLANSAAIIQHSATHEHWVRPGIMLYGANPLAPIEALKYPADLRAAMTLTTTVIAIRTVKKGESVGYNQRWTASKDSLIATLAIGYGDGYPRHAKNGTPVLINNERAFLVGTVSMDLISVDISHCQPVNIGDQAILWGEHLSANEIAHCADTISYELFTSVTKRVPRAYINA